MMRKLVRWVMALVLAMLLLMGTASAGVAGLDSAMSAYLDLNSDVRFSYTVELDTLLPYGEEAIAMFNGVLKHVNIASAIVGDSTTMSIGVDGHSVLEITERQTERGTELTTPLLPNRTLVSAGSVMDALSGTEAGSEASFDVFLAIEQAEDCYEKLTDAIIPYAEEKKANYKIKEVGASKWSRIARLTPEQGDELAPLIAELLGCGMDEAYQEQLRDMRYAKGFVVALYQTAEGGADIAVYMKGNVTFADGASGSLSYQWAFTDNETKRVDTYKFELSRSKAPRDSRVISASYTRRDAFSLSGDSKAVIKENDSTVTTTLKHKLSGGDKDGVRTLEGDVTKTVKTTVDSDSETITTVYTPKLALTSEAGSGVLSGTVSMEEKTGRNTTSQLTLAFDSQPAQGLAAAADSGELFAVSDGGGVAYDPMPQSSLMQNEEIIEQASDDYLVGQPPIGLSTYTTPTTMQVFDLDSASAEQMDTLMGELAQTLAGRLLIALAALPEEDRALLQDNLSDGDFATFLTLVEGL